jgi:hypothetical protein
MAYDTARRVGPKIVYIIGTHKTVVDAISRLEYDPTINQTAESYFTTKVKMNPKKRSETKRDDSLKKRCEI